MKSTTVHLDAKDVPANLRNLHNYNGKKFKAEVGGQMTVPADAGLWFEGSRDLYFAVKFETGEVVEWPNQNAAPWDPRAANTVKLEPGFCVVRHSIFCGNDMGLTFYLHPDNATKLLPPPIELSRVEKLVLEATGSLKSSHGGRDRYEMMRDQCRYGAEQDTFPTRDEWNAAKQTLIGRGLLNKAGAITTQGRNAR